MFKRFSILTFAPLALLLIPLIAMHYSDEVHWTLIDFAIMGVLLLVAGMWTQRVVKRVKSFPRRATYIILVILSFYWYGQNWLLEFLVLLSQGINLKVVSE
jgi:hypothetical protein